MLSGNSRQWRIKLIAPFTGGRSAQIWVPIKLLISRGHPSGRGLYPGKFVLHAARLERCHDAKHIHRADGVEAILTSPFGRQIRPERCVTTSVVTFDPWTPWTRRYRETL